MPEHNKYTMNYIHVCVLTFTGNCLATKVFVGNFPGGGGSSKSRPVMNGGQTTNKQVIGMHLTMYLMQLPCTLRGVHACPVANAPENSNV